jgi:hypothetical protein
MLITFGIGLLFAAMWVTAEGMLVPTITNIMHIPTDSMNGVTWSKAQMSSLNTGEWIILILNLCMPAAGLIYGLLLVNEDENIVYQR